MACFQIEDGKTYSDLDLMGFLDTKTERTTKEKIEKLAIPFYPEGKRWLMAGEDIRAGFRRNAKTVAEHRESTPGFGVAKGNKGDG